jgi:hypothetical protein
VDYDACANLGKHRVVCGVSWLLRVIDHEAVLMEPKQNLKLGSQVSGFVETKVWTAYKQPVALLAKKNDWIVQVIPQHAIEAIRALSATRKIVIGWQELGIGMALFTTALGLYVARMLPIGPEGPQAGFSTLRCVSRGFGKTNRVRGLLAPPVVPRSWVPLSAERGRAA